MNPMVSARAVGEALPRAAPRFSASLGAGGSFSAAPKQPLSLCRGISSGYNPFPEQLLLLE